MKQIQTKHAILMALTLWAGMAQASFLSRAASSLRGLAVPILGTAAVGGAIANDQYKKANSEPVTEAPTVKAPETPVAPTVDPELAARRVRNAELRDTRTQVLREKELQRQLDEARTVTGMAGNTKKLVTEKAQAAGTSASNSFRNNSVVNWVYEHPKTTIGLTLATFIGGYFLNKYMKKALTPVQQKEKSEKAAQKLICHMTCPNENCKNPSGAEFTCIRVKGEIKTLHTVCNNCHKEAVKAAKAARVKKAKKALKQATVAGCLFVGAYKLYKGYKGRVAKAISAPQAQQ